MKFPRLLGHQHNATALVQDYIKTNQKSALKPLSTTEAASLGQLLCGLTEAQWEELLSPASFPALVTAYLARLECSVSQRTAAHLASLLVIIPYPVNNTISGYIGDHVRGPGLLEHLRRAQHGVARIHNLPQPGKWTYFRLDFHLDF